MATICLPDDAKRLLIDVGLPRCVDETMRCDLTLDQMRQSAENHSYLVVGYVVDCAVCVERHNGGRVYCLEPERIERFVNSDIRCFIECMTIYERYRRTVCEIKDEERIERLVSNTGEELRIVDPAAFRDPEYWWPVIVEQMRDGLL